MKITLGHWLISLKDDEFKDLLIENPFVPECFKAKGKDLKF